MKYPRHPILTGAIAVLCMTAGFAQGALIGDFHKTEENLNEGLLDAYAGDMARAQIAISSQGLAGLSSYCTDPASFLLIDKAAKAGGSIPSQVGQQRAYLQQIAALEMIAAQRTGNVDLAQQWRALIVLPRFASEQDNTLLLQTTAASASSPEVSKVLAKEYLLWQSMRVRQLLDFLQQQIAKGRATQGVVEAYSAEIKNLAHFPSSLLQTAGIAPQTEVTTSSPDWKSGEEHGLQAQAMMQWREELESTLPNLLSNDDISRMQRLLARLLKIIPREYQNGVADGRIIVNLEYREAVQFTEKAQSLVNQLAPVWKQEHPEAYKKYHGEITEQLEKLAVRIPSLVPQKEIDDRAAEVVKLLDREFQITARRPGDKNDVIEETALEVRASLGSSLAAIQAEQWETAEALRMDAYTAFDSEIEPRVLPRNPDLGRRAERSFLDGEEGARGIKLLIDHRAPMEEIQAAYERCLTLLDQSIEVLKVSVSPTTIGVTAFGIVAREGLEAVVILTALLAGLRGPGQKSTRSGIVQGAVLALVATGITFWLSRTIITSLIQYGEKLEAVVSILAVIILLIVTNWVFHKFYWAGWNSRLRSLSKSATGVSQRWEWLALLGVGFLTVYREGFETALFMQSLLLEGNTNAVLLGALAACVFIGGVGVLTFRYGVKLPYRKMLILTGLLVVSIMVTFMGSTVRLFQTVGWLPIHPIPHLHIPNWVSLWFGIYPSWEGILIPFGTLAYVGGAWLLTKWSSSRQQRRLEAEQAASAAAAIRI
ncbi:MAG: FTR1 family protein [Chthoniobacterales bacterium]